MDKMFLSADGLLQDSFLLAKKIRASGFRPDWILGVWRGGTPVAIAVHEYFCYTGHTAEHFVVQSISYTGIAEQDKKIKLRGVEEFLTLASKTDTILLVDDVFDTGLSIQTLINVINNEYEYKILIATPWYKPDNNKTRIKPDFYLRTTDKWIVFPHELVGLGEDELIQKSVIVP